MFEKSTISQALLGRDFKSRLEASNSPIDSWAKLGNSFELHFVPGVFPAMTIGVFPITDSFFERLQMLFFPNIAFAWTFVVLLLAIATVAAFEDFRRMVIPKWLTYPMVVSGLLINLIRGAWLGHLGQKAWLLGPGSAWLGAIDAALFSLLGFFVGFVVLFLLWLARSCGGGDVKLFAGVGAWLGPMNVLYVLAITLPILVVLFILKAIFVGTEFKPGVDPASEVGGPPDKQKHARKGGVEQKSPKMRLTYSFPVALALLVFLLWTFRDELHLISAI